MSTRRFHYYDDDAESHDELVNPRPVFIKIKNKERRNSNHNN